MSPISIQPDMDSHDRCLRLRDGRKLTYTDLGDPEGTPVFFAHGMPGSRLEGWFFHQQARRHHFRIITPDRPGIGGSTFQPNRTLLDYPRDVEQLANALEIERFIHAGWSSGGTRTLACGYALPERVIQAVVMSSYTHFEEYPGTRAFLQATRWPGPKLAKMGFSIMRAAVAVVVWLAQRHPGFYFREARHMISEQDRELLSSFMHNQLFRRDQALCLASGGRAIAQDLQTELLDWGFVLNQVGVPVMLYQGDQDPFVPVEYARHMESHLPDADLTLMPGKGHLYPLSEAFQSTLFERLRQVVG
ncbi:alpha/beta hydrolase [Marinobacter sp. BGYM27]|uniref:alpha/beta fold hydrolase n=1 Tax=Marinobacter sp. BGYM27 TaxID=2975597 RepID=UPI0021A70863|nr:alpha/beta hydrolase [Marinobacter sp. BGYM27]MDG5500031.1 alpha/beta hydrolase [Marinobacter sp. BGYM27]